MTTPRGAVESRLLRISPEVASAVFGGLPVVAFESTIISHGLPWPRNIETALEAEDLARRHGAVPATVAVLEGRMAIGLDRSTMERLASGKDVLKVSRRDMAWALAEGRTGATTVSATMIAARAAGIDVFATGGIGGVHRGGSDTGDVSADLAELAATSVCVVSSGAKAILDLPRTLETLETLGVPVVGFGTSEFPAFYSRSSGLPAPLRADSARQVALMLRTQRGLGFPQGILVANPVPARNEIPRAVVDQWIAAAVRDLEDKGISGKEVTPFLLGRLVELSGGASLETNVALFLNNVKLACDVAAALARAPERTGAS